MKGRKQIEIIGKYREEMSKGKGKGGGSVAREGMVARKRYELEEVGIEGKSETGVKIIKEEAKEARGGKRSA
jgi:hypothetical protein